MRRPLGWGHISRPSSLRIETMAKSPHPSGDHRRASAPPLPSAAEEPEEHRGAAKRRRLKGFHAESLQRVKPDAGGPQARQSRNGVAFSAKELDDTILGPKARLTPPGQVIDHRARAHEAFERIARERPVLGPGWIEDRLEFALDQYCLIGKILIDFFFADESINSAKLAGDIERSLRRALAQMDEEKQRRLIAALMALAGELQSVRLLKTVPPSRLVEVGLLIAKAHAAVIVEPTDVQSANRATIDHSAQDHERDGAPLWREREADPKTGKRPTAIEWFDLHWKPRVMAGEVTGDDIRHADTQFYTTWAAALSKRGQKVGDFVPPSPTRGKKPFSEERLAARRAAGAERKRRWREAQAKPQ